MIQPRRAVHAAALAVSAAVGGALASVLAWRLSGGGEGLVETIASIWLVTGIATLLGAWPVVFGGRMPASRFGALVMAGSGVRLLATLGVGAALDFGAAGDGVVRTAFWLGVVLAGVVVLIGDSAMAVSILSGGGARSDRLDEPNYAGSSREPA